MDCNIMLHCIVLPAHTSGLLFLQAVLFSYKNQFSVYYSYKSKQKNRLKSIVVNSRLLRQNCLPLTLKTQTKTAVLSESLISFKG